MARKPKKQADIARAEKSIKSTQKEIAKVLAPLRKQLNNTDIGVTQFRGMLGKLQRAGIVSNKVDTRHQAPTRHYVSLVRKFQDVITGTAQTIRVPQKERGFFTQAGYRVHGTAAVIPVQPGEKVKRLPPENGIPQFSVESARRTIVRKLVPYMTLEEYIRNEIANAPPLEKGESYAFKFYGGYSRESFHDTKKQSAKDAMLSYILKYDSIEASDKETALQELYQAFEVSKILSPEEWREEGDAVREARQNSVYTRNKNYANEKRRQKYAERNEFAKIREADRRKRNQSADSARRAAKRAELKKDPVAWQAMLDYNRSKRKKE